jgi:hypothetical protein
MWHSDTSNLLQFIRTSFSVRLCNESAGISTEPELPTKFSYGSVFQRTIVCVHPTTEFILPVGRVESHGVNKSQFRGLPCCQILYGNLKKKCGSAVWNSFCFNILTPGISKWILRFVENTCTHDMGEHANFAPEWAMKVQKGSRSIDLLFL